MSNRIHLHHFQVSASSWQRAKLWDSYTCRNFKRSHMWAPTTPSYCGIPPIPFHHAFPPSARCRMEGLQQEESGLSAHQWGFISAYPCDSCDILIKLTWQWKSPKLATLVLIEIADVDGNSAAFTTEEKSCWKAAGPKYEPNSTIP